MNASWVIASPPVASTARVVVSGHVSQEGVSIQPSRSPGASRLLALPSSTTRSGARPWTAPGRCSDSSES